MNLTSAHEHLLETLASHAWDLQVGITDGVLEAVEHDFAYVPPLHRKLAADLVRWGLAEKPDNSRMRRWFRITQAGLERYAQVEYDRENEPDDELQAQYQDALRRVRLSPENWRYELALIQVEARVAYRVLARDMAAGGYLYTAEPGHTPARFRVWFYGLHNGEYRYFEYHSRPGDYGWKEKFARHYVSRPPRGGDADSVPIPTPIEDLKPLNF